MIQKRTAKIIPVVKKMPTMRDVESLMCTIF